MPAPPPESDPAIVSARGIGIIPVLLTLCRRAPAREVVPAGGPEGLPFSGGRDHPPALEVGQHVADPRDVDARGFRDLVRPSVKRRPGGEEYFVVVATAERPTLHRDSGRAGGLRQP